ncbi:MAG TPA: rRNA pseudouridine synthase [Dehalococcoidia bacterium]|nr:rRNA pseudouridine synthase [Dehalococcoidia bacterium]
MTHRVNRYGERRLKSVGTEKRSTAIPHSRAHKQAKAPLSKTTAVVKTPQIDRGPLLKTLTSNRIGSRRDVAAAIKYGRVTVNGKPVENFSLPVNLKKDIVVINGKRIQPNLFRRIVLIFNKPPGVVTTTNDEMGRTTVMELLPPKYRNLGLYPVGRLDRESAGLLLITNDGDLTYRLTHPKFEHEKEYLVAVNGRLAQGELEAVRTGVPLEEGVTGPAMLTEVRGQLPFNYRMIIHEGKKRQIRRTFEAIGYRVTALKRIRVGPLELGTLPEGSVRELTDEEIARLSIKASTHLSPHRERRLESNRQHKFVPQPPPGGQRRSHR